ncbi:MAG: 2Fe-2S iron-sulfur cluster binding domain-containing protein, partial [Clostridia bacterium]|nr:2Fe-2S iron-sulfur cluster binding domain-containing protein [Clostridia bacterium]
MSKATRIRLGSSAVGRNLATYLAQAGYLLHADCGGRGTCGKCRVQLAGGYLYKNPECTQFAEPDKDGYVLACRTWGCSGAIIVLPDQDGDGLTEFSVQATSAPTKASGLGIALDVGTTTLAAALVELASGKVLATTSALNPQASFGADVISRIQSATERPQTLEQMQSVLLTRVRIMMDELAGGKKLTRMTVAGNPTMLHIFCGISPAGMGAYPFTPAFTQVKTLTGEELDLTVQDETCLPRISAFVGGD